MMKRQPVDFEQHYVKHGYKELSILPDKHGAAKLPVNYLHIWPREKFMLIALPNQDNSFTVTLFYPYEELLAIKTKDQIVGLFQAHFPDALELIGKEALVKAFLGNPSAPLVTVKLSKYHYKDKLLLLGDAIHAMVPFYGQGMNAGFEDCRLFAELLDKMGTDDLGKVFESFTTGRVADAHAICELALYNYLEMSTLVASRWFLAKRWFYSWLHWAAPSTIIPLYTMVSFSPHIAYGEAIRRRDRQERLVALAGGSLLGAAALIAGFGLYRKPSRSP
jgi:kynurenine 3-monooxygenase